LTVADVDLMTTKKDVMARMDESYKFFLNFMGFDVVNSETGELKALNEPVHSQRLTNIGNRTHNHLRITRIMHWLKATRRFAALKNFVTMIRENITEIKPSDTTVNDYWIPAASFKGFVPTFSKEESTTPL